MSGGGTEGYSKRRDFERGERVFNGVNRQFQITICAFDGMDRVDSPKDAVPRRRSFPTTRSIVDSRERAPEDSSSWTRKAIAFASSNATACLASLPAYFVSEADSSPLARYVASVVRLVVVLVVISYGTRHKTPLNRRPRRKTTEASAAAREDARSGRIESALRMLFLAAPTEALMFYLSQKLVVGDSVDVLPTSATGIALFYCQFVLLSFFFEISFDFGHYWAHRACHEIRPLYRASHKTHHVHVHPSPLSTFHQDPVDLILSNVLPVALATSVVVRPWIRLVEAPNLCLALLYGYKSFIEVAGHAGKDAKSCSFPQCTVLPKTLGIEMKTADHDLHHTFVPNSTTPSAFRRGCNFSKRFILWDKVFGTYNDAGRRAA